MRDIIWTIITVWFIWKIIEAFRSYSAAKNTRANTVRNEYTSNTNTTSQNAQVKKGELKSDAGEYIDYEEVK